MAGLDRNTPLPTSLTVQQRARTLEIAFEDGLEATLSHEFLRVYSPSAEVRGHGPGQEVLQVGKRDVVLVDVEQVGNYAVKLIFSDGHESGLYSWDYLYDLASQQEALWSEYITRVTLEGASRDPAAPVPEHLQPAPRGGCSNH